MVVKWTYLTKNKEPIRSETFSNIQKAELVMNLMAVDEVYQKYIPKNAEYVKLEDELGEDSLYWIDRRESLIEFKPWD